MTSASVIPTAANSSPIRSVVSSESTALTVGSFDCRTYLSSGTPASRASPRTCRIARANEIPSATAANTTVPIASQKLSLPPPDSSASTPWPIEKIAPARKISTAASSVQKNRSLP